MKNILLIYAYYESNEAKINLEFFNKFGMYRTENVFYKLMISSQTCSVNLSDRWSSIQNRENLGFDFGAWYDGLQSVNINNFTHFIFINDTMRGPFKKKRWIKTLIELLDDKIKLSGISISCYIGPFVDPIPSPHIQSMILCTDRQGLDIIYPKVINEQRLDKIQTILQKEIITSKTLLDNGYNIACILSGYNYDFRKLENRLINSNNGHNGDPWYNHSFFGNTIHPYESIFFKTNRGVNPEILESLTIKQNKEKWY